VWLAVWLGSGADKPGRGGRVAIGWAAGGVRLPHPSLVHRRDKQASGRRQPGARGGSDTVDRLAAASGAGRGAIDASERGECGAEPVRARGVG